MSGMYKSYDPEMSYDPTEKLGVQGTGGVPLYAAATEMNRAKFDVTITNTAGTAFAGRIDLFNYLYSSSRFTDSSVVQDGGAPAAWSNAGVLTFTDGTNSVAVSSSTPELGSYRAIFESLAFDSVKVDLMRIRVANASQFAGDIQIKSKTLFGASKSNTIDPNSYVNPDQNQSLIVDIPQEFIIDNETGLFVNIINYAYLPITISFFVAEFAKPNSGRVLA